MTNREIAQHFNLLGQIMELYGENPFKIRSYQNAYLNLRKLDQPLAEMSDEEISAIKGVGKAITGKIRELLESGQMQTLQKYLDKTPPGIIELLGLKGFGPKKIKQLWDGLQIESPGELLYACVENRLVELKGFGLKTQEDLKNKLEYFLRSKNKYHYARLEAEAGEWLEKIRAHYPDTKIELTGAIRRKDIVLDGIDFLIGHQQPLDALFSEGDLTKVKTETGLVHALSPLETPVFLYQCAPADFGSKWFRYTATPTFIDGFMNAFPGKNFKGLESEAAVFEKAGLSVIPPELRENADWIKSAQQNALPDLIVDDHIRGVVHSHSTYSDGIHSLAKMAEYTKDQGFEYLVITDHSKSAFYANGLKEDRLLQQMDEVDQLNQQYQGFRIFKGIESDILNDGSLDYSDDILKKFDLIIASVHSNLRMDEAKATQRLLTAIENPFTTMLGHPTGRLLLSRPGYPIDHKKVIDACAANQVAIELNANPYRLDLDYSWISYAIKKGVWISINPDAHSTSGIHDIHFGVAAARKGGLTKAYCLNAKPLNEFAAYLADRKRR